MTQAQSILQSVFGYDEFRHSQQAIIDNIIEHQNTLAIMPTGGGKSICYQIPALVLDGLTIVISPLISLMQDQVRQLLELDISAVVLNSSLSTQEYQHNVDQISQGLCKLVFLAPETALQPAILNILKSTEVACLAIDEAHCISEWGHEFRPEYRQLHLLTEHFPNAVVIALTATATPRVREDIKRQLAISDNSEFIASFDRPNLFIEVAPKESAYAQTKAFIDKHPQQSGIIYCQSRSGVDELTQKLQHDGYSALAYHAGLNSQKRSDYQEKFVRDDVHIIVATIAFGMGINKPDVRYVLHYDLPKNIEGYYQQIGRAGRDGLDADCLLLFGYGDTGKIRYFIDQMMNEQEKRLATMHLQQMLALAETEDCRRIPLLHYFGEEDFEQHCSKCDNCLSEDKEKSDLTVPAQKFLSCVHRTGQRFGASHIIDVLRGSNAEKVLQNQHNLLSTYDIGNELNKKQWMALSRKLIQKGLLKQEEQFGGLKLTAKASDVLKGKVPFFALLQQSVETKKSANSALVTGDQVLLQTLKRQRKQLADTASVPPYAIFSDRSLQEMAHYFPHSSESLLQIHGVGQSKLTKYGNVFLSLIKQYCDEHSISEVKNDERPSKISSTQSNSKLSTKALEIAKAFDLGENVKALSSRYNVKPNTIFTHLYNYVKNDNRLNNIAHLQAQMSMTEADIAQAKITAGEHGIERLKPIFESLNGDVSYEQLHVFRLFYMLQIK